MSSIRRRSQIYSSRRIKKQQPPTLLPLLNSLVHYVVTFCLAYRTNNVWATKGGCNPPHVIREKEGIKYQFIVLLYTPLLSCISVLVMSWTKSWNYMEQSVNTNALIIIFSICPNWLRTPFQSIHYQH